MCLAIPGKLLDISGDHPLLRTGRVSFGGAVKVVSLACVPDAHPGDYVLVHVGLALSVVDPEEAETTERYLREMGEFPEAPPEPAEPPR